MKNEQLSIKIILNLKDTRLKKEVERSEIPTVASRSESLLKLNIFFYLKTL